MAVSDDGADDLNPGYMWRVFGHEDVTDQEMRGRFLASEVSLPQAIVLSCPLFSRTLRFGLTPAQDLIWLGTVVSLLRAC